MHNFSLAIKQNPQPFAVGISLVPEEQNHLQKPHFGTLGSSIKDSTRCPARSNPKGKFLCLPLGGHILSHCLLLGRQQMPGDPATGEPCPLVPPNPLQFHALDSIQDMPSLKYEKPLSESAVRVQKVFCELCPSDRKYYGCNNLGLPYYFPLD